MKEYIKLYIMSFIGWVKDLFTFNEAFFKILNQYKTVVNFHCLELFFDFKQTINNKSFWLSFVYNKSHGIFYNFILFCLAAPIFRFIARLLRAVFKIFYGFYYIFINLVFDLIVKYIDIYAIKWHILYEPILIKDVNIIRRLVLFKNFKENFLNNFKSVKDINIDGFVYKEETHTKYIRIFSNVSLFFIWHMPLILSFISYFFRVFISLIWSIFRRIFWFFVVYFFLFVRKVFIRIYYTFKLLKIFKIRYKRKTLEYRRFIYKIKRQNILSRNSFFFLLKLFIGKFYDDLSVFFKVRNKYVRIVKNTYYKKYKYCKSKLKNIYYNRYKYLYNYCKLFGDIHVNKNFNVYDFIKNKIDDVFVRELEPFDIGLKKIDTYYNNDYKILTILKSSILHKLNIDSIAIMIHYFISFYLSDYKKYEYTHIYKNKVYRKYFLKVLRIIVLLNWEIFFPIYVLILEVLILLYKYVYLFFSIIYYFLRCFLQIIIIVLRFILFLLIAIFFGRSKD